MYAHHSPHISHMLTQLFFVDFILSMSISLNLFVCLSCMITIVFRNSGFNRTLCGGGWLLYKHQWTGNSTARYGCCSAGSYMSSPFIDFNESSSCTACDTGHRDVLGLNDETSCFAKLPDGNGEHKAAKRTSGTLGRIVDNWLAVEGTGRSDVEVVYGLIEDWDVSAVANFKHLFYKKDTFNADISKWDVTAAESLHSSECRSFSLVRLIGSFS